jgi:putative heme-binding domain-containing protein
MTLLSSGSSSAREAWQRVKTALMRASVLAVAEDAPGDQRLAAIALMGQTDYAAAGRTLESLLEPRRPADVQVAAVRALAQLHGREGIGALVERRRWLAYTPQVREAVLSSLLSDDRQTPVLLDALEAGSIAPATLGAARRDRLLNHRNAALQKRARALLLGTGEPGDRMQVYERLRGPVLGRAADRASGKRVFAAVCAPCHAFAGGGGQVGPDLSGIRNQPADAILLHVLVPDQEIAPGYQAYMVETREGKTVFGRLESEAPNSLTLRDASSESHVILRSQVLSISASPNSLMPTELERAMSEQELADVIGYLKADPASAGKN